MRETFCIKIYLTQEASRAKRIVKRLSSTEKLWFSPPPGWVLNESGINSSPFWSLIYLELGCLDLLKLCTEKIQTDM